MRSGKTIAILIVLSTAVAGAVGVVTGFFNITTAVGIAICGIVIGFGVVRGAFSATPDPKTQN
jgi:hypothetical protein